MSRPPSLLGSLESYAPWSTRPGNNNSAATAKDDENIGSGNPASGADHALGNQPWIRSRDYPRDCPKAAARWFYATDAPKRKAAYSLTSTAIEEELPKPKKFSAFSVSDSAAVESAFQQLLDKSEASKDKDSLVEEAGGEGIDLGSTEASTAVKVPVNEDFLFDVDIQRRELGPAYWLGPIYDVRRGSWFYQEGTNLRPCDENLARQLELGYLRTRPWQPRPEGQDGEKDSAASKFAMQTQRLFGSYMNSMVTYQDSTIAWILTDDFLSRMSSTVYQRFAGGGHLGGVKVVRGYSEANKVKKAIRDPAADAASKTTPKADEEEEPPRSPILELHRQLSSYESEDQEAEARRRDEDEIKSDYKEAEGEDQGREIEHLLLVTHGIGQKLGLRLEMLNFIRDVNLLRKTMKGVYQSSPDLQLLNSELDKLPKNCRIQVLPIAWRHLLDFPRQTHRQAREQDLTETADEDEYPSLDNITLEPSTIVRSVIRDLGLDILMYQSAYNQYISRIVVTECNRVYDIFMRRNPQFVGKVSLIGHSLGSAILFDILCQQRDTPRRRKSSNRQTHHEEHEATLKFPVEDYYCLGSPLGLYQMLNGRKIKARHHLSSAEIADRQATDDPFLAASNPSPASTSDPFAISNSQPKCAQLFNIFHPADPIAYRLEPLISTAMNSLKPQPLPYTKRGMFDMQGQGLSAIGNRVGQSVSGLWSSVTSNVASSFLHRSLGLTPDSKPTAATPQIQTKSADMVKSSGPDAERPATLIDGELETLYSGFEKSRRVSKPPDEQEASISTADLEGRRRRLRREEAKVRAMNSNGRVDFCIQPGVFDMTNPMAGFASHMCYWADEDVSHFMISQLLSRQRIVKPS